MVEEVEYTWGTIDVLGNNANMTFAVCLEEFTQKLNVEMVSYIHNDKSCGSRNSIG
ncbi:hypothetical protein DNHGIG_24480 [Collibacillus ludicampi]|jgi:hypothetical protein|uniref:Uncharacterized protein n=1 Tax=Collibacillus ludicampi TaxID=2771369 RepID=A0AAV4LHB5_9BACL|nr:hypothetical protein [Collibacillus ludicampi]GIM46899.1 hypothetical protein DNHGIG_24480 [Collibacillus ludicampi]